MIGEVIDPRGDFFYSHSYIFNYGIPFKHTGVLAVSHVTPLLDLYYGYDTGVNTTFGAGNGDDNGSGAFHGGFGLNLLNGDLTVLATTHIGKELPTHNELAIAGVSTRYLNDVVVVWKITKNLTSTTDVNYIRDDTTNFAVNTVHGAEGYGVAQYLAYNYNDNLSFGLRGEIWRDDQGAFVGAFPRNLDFVNAELGHFNSSIFIPKGTTYYALTAGANIKLNADKMFEGIMIRPEVRYDLSSETKPYHGGTDDHAWTLGADVVVPFKIWH